MPTSRTLQSLPVIIDRLKGAYPNARYELNWDNPLQLLVATILAAQCTDERVNQVTPALFARYPDAAAFADADLAELEEAVRPTGFYKNKAKAIQGACAALVERFGGQVPRSMEQMLTLPGVARKTANVVLNNAFRIPSGVIVDSHVARVSRRLGLTDNDRPERIEEDLMRSVPKDEWVQFGPALVLHGRYTCTSSAPKCSQCIFDDLCPKIGVAGAASAEEEPPAPRPAPARPARRAATEPTDDDFEPRGKGPSQAMNTQIPASWKAVLADEFMKPSFKQLEQFVDGERAAHQVFPPEQDVFNALKLTPYDKVKVLLLGQDPYHDDGQAHGLCFSVRPGIKPPPSLVNMFKELKNDLGCRIPNNGYLVPWAEQGVLLLNAVLTVRAHQPNSHKDRGWEKFTDAVIQAVNDRPDPVVFVLWGAYAQKKGKHIDTGRHRVLTAAHPSPLSAAKFFGSKPFSAVNNALKEFGEKPINWQLPDL
jgi:uracil-DNA glycosylase